MHGLRAIGSAISCRERRKKRKWSNGAIRPAHKVACGSVTQNTLRFFDCARAARDTTMALT